MRRSPHAERFGRRSEEFVPKNHVEVEWQFEVTDLDLAESWLKKLSPTSDLAAIADSTKELLDANYDTEDGRSYRAGYSLSVRRDGESAEATMKVLTPAEGALRQRREISEPLKGNAKPPKVTRGPVGERVSRLAGSRDHRPLFKVGHRQAALAAYARSPALYSWSALQLDVNSAFPARCLVGYLFSRRLSVWRLLANLGSLKR